MCADNQNLLLGFSPKARFRPRTYAVILRFVPCTGQFDPSAEAHLREIEAENDIPPNSIASASRCKRPEKRSPGQKTATLKVLCTNPEAANLFITGHIRVEDHIVTVHKDIRLPIRCVKCQEYGHTRDACAGVARCVNCSSESHIAINCSNKRAPSCVSCGPGSTHPSTAPSCPVFARKCASLEDWSPENTMPYFPTNEACTWATSPSNPPRPTMPLPEPPQIRTNPRLRAPCTGSNAYRPESQTSNYNPDVRSRHTDNGWPASKRQTTLPNHLGTQPSTGTSSQHSNQLPPPQSQ